MKDMMLQIRTTTQSESGQKKETWSDVKTIRICIYPTGGGKNQTNNQVYVESTHTGITYEKGIKEVINRLLDPLSGEIYEITLATNRIKAWELLLKKVVFNG
jgi:hypothetical protein